MATCSGQLPSQARHALWRHDVDISVQTICCHGDTPGARNIVRTVREALDRAGCQVKPLRDFLPKV